MADHQRRRHRARRRTETDGNCLIRLSAFSVAADTTQPVQLAETDIRNMQRDTGRRGEMEALGRYRQHSHADKSGVAAAQIS